MLIMNKKIFLKKTALFLSTVLILMTLFMPFASAVNSNGTSISTQGLSKPQTAWDWSKGAYKFSGTSTDSILYTNYYFTNANQVRITVNNNSGFTTTIRVLKSQVGIDFSVSTVKLQGGQTATWTVELESSREYMLSFTAPAEFNGTIEKLA